MKKHNPSTGTKPSFNLSDFDSIGFVMPGRPQSGTPRHNIAVRMAVWSLSNLYKDIFKKFSDNVETFEPLTYDE